VPNLCFLFVRVWLVDLQGLLRLSLVLLDVICEGLILIWQNELVWKMVFVEVIDQVPEDAPHVIIRPESNQFSHEVSLLEL